MSYRHIIVNHSLNNLISKQIFKMNKLDIDRKLIRFKEERRAKDRFWSILLNRINAVMSGIRVDGRTPSAP